MLPWAETPSSYSGCGTQSWLVSAQRSRQTGALGAGHMLGYCVLEVSGPGSPEISQRGQVHRGVGVRRKTELNPGTTFQRLIIKVEDLGKGKPGNRSTENSTEKRRALSQG